jgi:hypothetical protein
MGIKTFLATTFFAAAFAGESYAEFSFVCGRGKDKGPSEAEVSLVDSLEASMKLYLMGVEVAGDKLAIKPTESGLWIATVDNGKSSRRFEFSQKNSLLQEFYTNQKGIDKKVGPSKACVFKVWEPRPE